MYKNYFKIGFGGCGCAFVDTFEEHVYRLFRSYLLEKYKELAKLSKVFSEDYRLKMKANLDRLKELIFEEKLDLDNLGNIEKHLNEWGKKLNDVKGGMKRSYEKTPVVGIESIIKELKVRLRGIKNKYGVWLEALTVDSYSSGEKEDKHRYLYNKYLDDTRQIRISEFGMDILDADGFNHHPELQMLPFTLQEVRNEVYTDLDSEIKKVNKRASRGHFFFLGLGGGTGTGVISPLAQEFSKGTRSYFTLGALGGEDDNDYLNSQQPWFRRCFNMLLALNDLIVTAKLDGLMLVDNNILMKNLKEKLNRIDSIEITNNSDEESLKEKLKQFLKNEFDIDEWVEDANIVISDDRQSIDFTKDDDFVEIRISPTEAKVIISDGTICTLEVSAKETEGTFNGTIWGKTNEKRVDEELIKKIFLAFGHTAFDQENLDWSQLRDAMDEYDKRKKFDKEKKKPIFVPCYASGEYDTASLIDQALENGKIDQALENGKLAECDHKKADRVFVYLRSGDAESQESIKKKLKEIFSGDKDIGLEDTDTDIVGFIALGDSSNQLEKKLQTKKIIVIEVKRREKIKKNEVLILLRNPDIRDLLENRLTIAKNFVYLLNDFIKDIDGGTGPLIDRVNTIIQTESDFFRDKYLSEVDKDKKIPTDGIERYLFTWGNGKRVLTRQEQRNIKEYISQEFEPDWKQAAIRIENNCVFIRNNKAEEATITIANKTCKVQFNEQERDLTVVKTVESGLRIYKRGEDPIKKILDEASSFLLPKIKEIEKQEDIYERMKDVVKRLFEKGEVDVNVAIENLQNNHWPIFGDKKRIFEIKPALATRHEIAVTTMLTSKDISDALGPKTVKDEFDTYQTETLKKLKDLNFVEGSDRDSYILTDYGEKVLSDLQLDQYPINEEIDDPYSLFEKVPKQKFLEASKKTINDTNVDINFPKLLILSLLYTKWEYVFGWANICVGDSNGDKKEFIEELGKISNFEWVANGAVKPLDENTVSISNDENLAEITICEKEKENERFKEIRAGRCRYLGDIIESDDLNKDAIRKQLEKVSRPNDFALPENLDLKEEGVNKWRIINNTGNETNYYVRAENGSIKIFEDKILELKVKKTEEGKLKIYKRR